MIPIFAEGISEHCWRLGMGNRRLWSGVVPLFHKRIYTFEPREDMEKET
jgi:hypothetical protein